MSTPWVWEGDASEDGQTLEIYAPSSWVGGRYEFARVEVTEDAERVVLGVLQRVVACDDPDPAGAWSLRLPVRLSAPLARRRLEALAVHPDAARPWWVWRKAPCLVVDRPSASELTVGFSSGGGYDTARARVTITETSTHVFVAVEQPFEISAAAVTADLRYGELGVRLSCPLGQREIRYADVDDDQLPAPRDPRSETF